MKYFSTLFPDNSVAFFIFNSVRNSQLVLEINRGASPFPFNNLSVPTSFEVLQFLHAFNVMNVAVNKKARKVPQCLLESDTYRALCTTR